MFSQQNLYPGINAHLNSLLQAEDGEWESFHAHHIGHLLEVVDAALPDGYFARSEKSLQIGAIYNESQTPATRTRKPDVTIFDEQARPSTEASATPAGVVMTLPLAASFPQALDLSSIQIYRVAKTPAGAQAIARIELLSPTNKPGRSGYIKYLENRLEALHSGLRLIEIDYLHRQPPISPALPRYPQDAASHPYSVLLSDPTPAFEQGRSWLYGWHVDEAAPTITIPLAGDDTVLLALQTAYERTFNGIRYYKLSVDYSALPTHCDAYSAADQARIQARLAHIRGQG